MAGPATARTVASLGDNLWVLAARLQLAQIGAADGHGCSEVDGLGLFCLAHRQPQARQVELAVLRVPKRTGGRHSYRG